MKYIRTKDGTIELNREEIEREIIKQADTIEELCDNLVYDNELYFTRKPNENKAQITFYDDFGMEEPITEEMLKKGIHGAIWVKGEFGEPILKSVACMNNGGVLELL